MNIRPFEPLYELWSQSSNAREEILKLRSMLGRTIDESGSELLLEMLRRCDDCARLMEETCTDMERLIRNMEEIDLKLLYAPPIDFGDE